MIQRSIAEEAETQRRERDGPLRKTATSNGEDRTPRKRSFDEPARPVTFSVMDGDDMDLDRRNVLGE